MEKPYLVSPGGELPPRDVRWENVSVFWTEGSIPTDDGDIWVCKLVMEVIYNNMVIYSAQSFGERVTGDEFYFILDQMIKQVDRELEVQHGPLRD